MGSTVLLCIAVLAAAAIACSAADDTPLLRLPVGSVRATGWLRTKLEAEEAGLAGHLSRFWPDVMNSTWIGGNATEQGGMHERAGYWLNGAVPLAFLLQPQPLPSGWPAACHGGHMAGFNETGSFRLVDEVGCYLKYIVDHQDADGWYGGAASYPASGGKPGGNDYWLSWNVVRALMAYAEGNPKAYSDVQGSLRRWLGFTQASLESTPLYWWSYVRWQDMSEVLLDLSQFFLSPPSVGADADAARRAAATARTVKKLGFDWLRWYSSPKPPSSQRIPIDQKTFPTGAVPFWDYDWHGVNNAMAVKAGAVSYLLTGDDVHMNQTDLMLRTLDEYHGRPDGAFNADECLGGRGSNRGVELCAIVELAYSLQVAFRVHRKSEWLDRIELLIHSSFPGALTDDLWAHNYLSQSNEIRSGNLKQVPWVTSGGGANQYGFSPNYGCCTSNFIQGYSKFAMAAVQVSAPAADASRQVYVSLYAPQAVTLPRHISGGGGGGRLEISTNYPWEDAATIEVTGIARAGLTLFLRCPGWCKTDCSITATGAIEVTGTGPGGFAEVVAGSGATTVVIRFDQPPYAVSGQAMSNALAVYKGPLLFSLPLQERVTVLTRYAFSARDLSIDTSSAWEKMLLVPEGTAARLRRDGGDGPVRVHLDGDVYDDAGGAGPCDVSLTMPAAVAPDWNATASRESVGLIPASPADRGGAPARNVTLVPYACTLLRISTFPWALESLDSGGGHTLLQPGAGPIANV